MANVPPLAGVREAAPTYASGEAQVSNARWQLGSLTPEQAQRIQAFVDKYGVEVSVVGSRARGTARPLSDFDYVIGGNAKVRASATYYLPKGVRTETSPGYDLINANKDPLRTNEAYITFRPGQAPEVGTGGAK